MAKGNPVLIQGIWLMRKGDYAVVLVEFPDGRQVEAIREHIDGPFSHFIHDHGLENLANGLENRK
jgi:hypothetical protein